MNLINRPRRLRNGALLRSMVRETRISADTLIYPMFVQDGENIREEIPSMPGQYRWSLDRVDELLQQVTDSGVKSVLLFGIPAEKDEIGSSAWQPDGIVQRAVHHIKAALPMFVCVSIPLTDTAAFSAVTMWITTRRWRFWRKRRCPMYRQERIWSHRPI